jgi:general secretion pathway protein D
MNRRVGSPNARRLLIAALTILFAGCASGSLERAKNADELHDYDVAVAEYTKALREHPDSQNARLGLETAKLRAAQAHYVHGQRLAASGRLDDAALELQISNDLNPSNADAAKALKSVRTEARAKLAAEATGGPTALERLLGTQRQLSTPGFTLPDTLLTEQIQTGEQATARMVYLAIARVANLSVTFDPTFQDRPAPVSLLANQMTIKESLAAVARATGTFYQVTGPNTIIVVPNTNAKQIEYQQQVVQTFYLQNGDPKEMTDLLRVVADARFEGTVNGVNAISVRDTPERVALIGRVLAAADKARPELVVDVEVLEVNRTKLVEYGLQIASNTATGPAAGPTGSISVNPDPASIAAIQNLTAANVIVSGIPALYYRLLKTDQNTRTLANPQIRMSDGMKGLAEFGTSLPLPVTTFAPVNQGGLNEQAVTQFEYKNIGVTINMTPRTHANDDVTLSLDVTLNNVNGTGINGLPTFGNRHVTTTIRLKDGETNILAGLIRNDETNQRDGMPGLSTLPGLGSVFSKTHKEREESDVVVMLTPHIIRGLTLTEEDLRPLMVPRDGMGGGEPAPVPSGPGRGGGGGNPNPEASALPIPVAPFPVAPVAAPIAPAPPPALTAPALPVAPGWPSGLTAVPLGAKPAPVIRK